ncbi:MAG: HdeD family acid-resistance protein [Xanthobacteraceae bacterium]
MVGLGVAAIAVPAISTLAVDIFIGWLFTISGVVGLVAVFSVSDIPAFVWTLVTAALSVAAGVLLIWRPIEGVLILTLVLTAFFVAEGLLQSAISIAYREVIPGSWGWMLLSGVMDLILAFIIFHDWPISADWTLGLLAGVNLITSGCAILMIALGGRKLAETFASF